MNRLSKGETTIQLELKVMDVLVCLADHAGGVVTRQEIIDRVWATEFISDNTLTHAITELRNALGDDAKNPSFIETIHRRGYRLIAPVEPSVSDEAGESKVARFPVSERQEDRSPYPGLSAFTEEDAEFFFGREDEVARMWRKLTSRRLLAVIGPSGVGKSSFIRAGVIPARPEGWAAIVCHPGEAPLASLACALAPEFEGDPEMISKLVDIGDETAAVAIVSRWRERHEQALLIVDQFEELFTLNPLEVQERFAELLARLARDADVHVLLSMRDDFLYRCHDHGPLMPIFSELSPVKVPGPEDLRRALVQPAARLGYSFDDDGLADEMLEAVKEERGALPMLAFAVARLWEKRDTDEKELTRSQYQGIGGVSGALAQHAESTLTAIGQNRFPIVRELFRNLVTAQGTRAIRSVDGLMSVFPEDRRDDATEVLKRLIDARLLTSFEEEDVEGDSRRRVEVVHESLLVSWPRLVGWQTQDADAARIRDELRQAARTWNDHDRTNDLLWTGAAFREFRLWHDRYPGGLTELEEDFATAMTAHAKRRKQRRRLAVAGAFVVLLGVLGIVGESRNQAKAETRRAEAAELFAFGQLEIEDYPSAAIAYAIASLELADRAATRHLALEALWRGPPAMVVKEGRIGRAGFTSDGRWLVETSFDEAQPLRIFSPDGSSELLAGTEGHRLHMWLPSADGGVFLTRFHDREQNTNLFVLWSPSERRKLAEVLYESGKRAGFGRRWTDDSIMFLVPEGNGRYSVDTLSFGGEHRRLGTRNLIPEYDEKSSFVRMNWGGGRWVAATNGHDVFVSEIGEHGLSEPRLLGRQPSVVSLLEVDALGRFIASADSKGRILLWSLKGLSGPEIIQGPPGIKDMWITRDGRYLRANSRPVTGDWEQWIWSLDGARPELLRRWSLGEAASMVIGILDPVRGQVVQLGVEQEIRLWSLSAPADAEPLILLPGDVRATNVPLFDPSGRWLVAPDNTGFTLWPLQRPHPIVIRHHEHGINALVFGPRGEWLASGSRDGTVKIWPLKGEVPPPGRILLESSGLVNGYVISLARSPAGDRLLVATGYTGVHLLSLDGALHRSLPDSPRTVAGGTFSPDGRLAAAAGAHDYSSRRRICVWNVESGEQIAVLAEGESKEYANPQFVGNGHLMALDKSGLRKWDIETGESELLYEGDFGAYRTTADQRRVLLFEAAESHDSPKIVSVDLETGAAAPLETHGDNKISAAVFDAAGKILVTGDVDGTIRVGLATGEEPHVLPGDRHKVTALAVDPLGRWIAAGSIDSTLRLWPMPDLSKPPLHTLPREELIAKLKTLTNVRVVRDEESATGWKLTHDPFPGWETVPSW